MENKTETQAIERSTDRIKNALVAFSDKLKLALPAGRDVNREIGSIVAAVAGNQDLQKCTTSSIVAASFAAATVGLPVDPLNLAYLVPYYNSQLSQHEAKYQISYKGYIQLATDSGILLSIETFVVYEGERFQYNPATGHIYHERKLADSADTKRKLKAVYCIALVAPGIKKVKVMDLAEIEHIRQKSVKNKQGEVASKAWRDDFNAMAQKVIIKQTLKLIPQYTTYLRNKSQIEASLFANLASDHVESQIDIDAKEVDGNFPVETIEPSSNEVLSKCQRLTAKIYDIFTDLADKGIALPDKLGSYPSNVDIDQLAGSEDLKALEEIYAACLSLYPKKDKK